MEHEHVLAGDLNGNAGPFKIVADCPVPEIGMVYLKRVSDESWPGHRFANGRHANCNEKREEGKKAEKDEVSIRDRGRPPAGVKQPSVCTKLSFLSQYVARVSKSVRLDSISSSGFEREACISDRKRLSDTRERIGKHRINYASLRAHVFETCFFLVHGSTKMRFLKYVRLFCLYLRSVELLRRSVIDAEFLALESTMLQRSE